MKYDTPTLLGSILGTAALVAWRAWPRRRYSFAGKRVLITGGSRGLGLNLARLLADEGARLFLLARTDRQLRRAGRELRDRGAQVETWVCDVRDPAAVTAAIERIVDETGGIDVLVNNAGIIQAAPLEHTTIGDYEASIETHFWAPLHAIRAALPHMRRQRSGRILNIASIGGLVAVPHLNPYAAGKAALVALSDGVRAEVAKDGILVTTATPGLMRTGSHLNVVVRGQHAREARLFTAMVATPLTSMHAARAARQILEACRRGRAHITTGWQAKTLARLDAFAPGTTAAIMAAVTKWLLPGPTPWLPNHRPRLARDVEFGWLARRMAAGPVVRNNEA